MQEAKRGCGYRKVGAMYLCGSGIALPCDALPLYIKACPSCGYKPAFTRGIQRVQGLWVAENAGRHTCTCPHTFCPLCKVFAPYYGLMWVGEKHYSADSFIKEAAIMGVSKRIADVPKWVKLGSTWILLAHTKVPYLKAGFNVAEVPAVFYAFIPQRIEVPIWKSKATKRRLKKMMDQGLTPVIFEDGDKDHE